MVMLSGRKNAPRRSNSTKLLTFFILLTLALCGILIHKSGFFLLPVQQQEQDEPAAAAAAALRKGTDKVVPGSPTIQVIKPIQLTNDKCESPLRGHFDNIYQSKLWGMHLRKASDHYTDSQWPIPEIRKKSASGSGSDLGNATQTSLRIIREAIVDYNVKSMIDVPCGDANWIFESYITDHLPLYLGLDVVTAVIDQNKLRFEHHVNKMFHFWDATLCPFPKFYNYTATMGENGDNHNPPVEKSFDLIHVRDVIQHLTLKQGVAFFCNVFKSGARVLITTTYPGQSSNKEIHESSWYPNDLALEPFSFPKGKCVPTHPDIEPDHTCVYNLTDARWVEEFVKSKC